MSRAARVRVKGVWYHVTNRGSNRRMIFETEPDHEKFLEYLSRLPERYGFKIHGYVLMGNHYHLLIEDPEMRISEGMKWLNLCYGISYNRRRKKVGPVFQGRFKGVILDPEERGLSVSRYVHLNPVRVRSLRMGKGEAKAVRAGKLSDPGLIQERLRRLKEYRWSSYRAYMGLEKQPEWLTTEFVIKKAGGKGEYRRQVEKEICGGMKENPWEEIKWGLVLGGDALQKQIKQSLSGNRREQKALREMESAGVSWERVIEVVEREKGERWEEFEDRYGDWGRNMVWILSQERGRMKLKEIGERCGVDYGTVASGIQQVRARMRKERGLERVYQKLRKSLINEK